MNDCEIEPLPNLYYLVNINIKIWLKVSILLFCLRSVDLYSTSDAYILHLNVGTIISR